MTSKNFTHLFLWQKAYKLTICIYKIGNIFPKCESYGLASQIKRSAHSTNSNICEGYHRKTTKEFIQFLYIAKGSLHETMNHLILARDLNYIDQKTFKKTIIQSEEIAKLIQTTINKISPS